MYRTLSDPIKDSEKAQGRELQRNSKEDDEMLASCDCQLRHCGSTSSSALIFLVFVSTFSLDMSIIIIILNQTFSLLTLINSHSTRIRRREERRDFYTHQQRSCPCNSHRWWISFARCRMYSVECFIIGDIMNHVYEIISRYYEITKATHAPCIFFFFRIFGKIKFGLNCNFASNMRIQN